MIITGPTYEFDDRVFADEGAVYDLGCLRWDWFAPFQGRKRYIGVDPQVAEAPDGATLVRAAVTPYSGVARMHGAGLGAAMADPTLPYQVCEQYAADRPERKQTGIYEVPAVTWRELTAEYGPAALVKMNIEGAEIPLLFTAPQPMAPQLLVAFHWPEMDGGQPNFPPNSAYTCCWEYLEQWYVSRVCGLKHSGRFAWLQFTLR